MVSASRSATGKPLLANDPHLRLTNPAAFYLASLKIPGLSLTGANFAGAPLFVIGHNQRIAWGYTNTGSHIQDAYLERVDPQDPRRYLTPDGYRPFETRLERIAVRDGEPVSLEVRSTRHGPVISDIYEPARLPQAQRDRLVIALAWTGLDHHDKTFPSLLAINRAEGWEQFLDAAADFGVPPQNMVYADVEGNIGYVSAGRVPLRGADDDLHGLAPRPAGRAATTGSATFRKAPSHAASTRAKGSSPRRTSASCRPTMPSTSATTGSCPTATTASASGSAAPASAPWKTAWSCRTTSSPA